jgi:ferric-dicitrate binding protein FerR (iron transport regulator)
MFSRHVTKDISAYCHGELSNEDSKKFAEHIISCVKCRTKFEEVKLGIKFAEQLPKLSAPDHLWREVEDLLDRGGEDSAGTVTVQRAPRRPFRAYAAAAAAVVIVAVGFAWFYSNLSNPSLPAPPQMPPLTAKTSWRVNRLDGRPRIGSQEISDDGEIAVGQVLETDGRSRARIAVGSIGNVDVDENTRIKLLATQPTEHRLELTRGKMSARIWAPPRLFFVDTPSAVAADMGCAYTLEVDDHGNSLLRVTSGWVALQLKDRESMVPAGAACETRKGIGPGTPYFVDASLAFREALKTLDFNDDPPARSKALFTLLDHAGSRDTLTLWHLLARVTPEERIHVFGRMSILSPPPLGVTRDGVLVLDQKMLQTWREALEPGWIGSEKGATKTADGAYWKKGLSPKMKDMMPK